MLTYWVMFLTPAAACFLPPSRRDSPAGWWIFVIVLTFLIGWRHEVGGDWFAYVGNFLDVQDMTMAEVLAYKDRGYYFVNWLAGHTGYGIYAVNLFCASVLVTGVSRFCQAQPSPWLAAAVATPYLLIVVAMGYTRQSAALGFVLHGLVAMRKGQPMRFVAWVVIGALFHKSAVLLIPIAALASSRYRLLTWTLVGVTFALAAVLVLQEQADALVETYVNSTVQSEGGLPRVAMNVVAAVLFLVNRRKFQLTPSERSLWTWISLFSIACLPALTISSTGTDRMALYFIPLQLFAFSRLPEIHRRSRAGVTLAVLLYYAAVLFVWLNYASHSFQWLPYQNMLTVESASY